MRGLEPDDRRRTTDDGQQHETPRRPSAVVCRPQSAICRLSGVVCLLALAGMAAAVAGEIEYLPTYEAAKAAAQANHQFVMIIIVAPGKDKQGREVCKLFREEVLPSEPVAKLIRRCFAPVLVDLTEVKAGRAQVPLVLQGQKLEGLPCVYFVDAEGKGVGKIVGYAEAPNYLPQLKAIAQKLGGVALPKEARAAERALQRGEDALERKDFRTALDALTSAAEGDLVGADKEKAQRLLAQVQAAATEKLEEGKTLEGEHKLGSAIRAYRACAWGFPGTVAASKAAERLGELGKDTDLRQKLHAFRARKLLAQAEAALARKAYAPAAAAVAQLLKDFADTEQAEAAKKLRAELDANPDAAVGIQDDRAKAEAERMLRMADMYRQNRMAARALAEYKRVVAKFPKTRYAETAQQKIQEITDESQQR
jgi:thioredoxin-related protein